MERKPSPKRKSQERFEQNNYLAREVAKTLRRPSHVAAVWMFWTYADTKGRFEMSSGLLADLINVSDRAARDILTELRQDGIIEYQDGKPSNGTANRWKLTWRPRKQGS